MKKKNNAIIYLLKKIRIRHLIVLIILLAFNTYAWFIYSTKVSAGLSSHVSSWNVSFEVGETESNTNITIDVNKIYPGMQNFSKVITVHNRGEVAADLKYKVKSYTLLGSTYETSETITSEALENQLKTIYPFKFNVATSNGNVQSDTDGTFTITVEWPFESGNDITDTYWGGTAYDYYASHPDDISLHIELELIAQQHTT